MMSDRHDRYERT